MRPALGAKVLASAVVTAVLLTTSAVAAQSLPETALKAAFLFNFAQFVEWPANALPARAPLALCIVNDAAVADALERTIRGRAVDGHDLTVGRLKAGAPLPTCHVLYLAGSDLKSTLDVIATVKDVSVLTVSDSSRFSRAGGMVELFIENGRMRFAVNVDALNRGRVRLSSQVLGLAKIVRDGDAP